MGDKQTRNSSDNGTKKDRNGHHVSGDLIWDGADFSWDDGQSDQTWDSGLSMGPGGASGEKMDRSSSNNGSKKTRN